MPSRRQAAPGRLEDPFARRAALVGTRTHDAVELGGDDPVVALVADGAADHLLGLAAVVDVGGVDEVDAGVARRGDHALRFGLVGRAAEHHGAEAEWRDLQAAAAELAVFHPALLLGGELRRGERHLSWPLPVRCPSCRSSRRL